MTSHSARYCPLLSNGPDLYRDSWKRSSRAHSLCVSVIAFTVCCAVQVPQLKLVLSSADNSNIFSLGVNFISSYNPRLVRLSPALPSRSRTREHLNSGFQHKFPTSAGVSRSCAVFPDFPSTPLLPECLVELQPENQHGPDRRGDVTL